ncbi:MAG: hypothetical protein LCI00_19445 [Chloroflexi bacterium]|nr:hypothetical protein [Chloroflexota bacterium]MCC6891424.1 hypothetical protein [Anaerolineae bacterium]
MSWKLQTQTQEISMVDRLVHYARTHNCNATDAAQDMRDILKKSPALDDISKAQAILDAEKQAAEEKKMGTRGEFYNWRD